MENLQYYRETKININLGAIHYNIQKLYQHLSPNVEIIAVVKANGYGHGDVAVAQAAMEAGVTTLAVATPEEAMRMREHFPTVDILVLGIVPVSFAPYAAAHNIMLTVATQQWVEQVQELPLSDQLRIHIKVDSGMGRIGVRSIQQLQQVVQAIGKTQQIVVDGIFTHFATADEENTAYFLQQAAFFDDCVKSLAYKPRLVHAGNTATALVQNVKYQYDAVRFGISMYGLYASSYAATKTPYTLQPALSFVTQLVHVKQIEAGDHVGYGANFTAPQKMWVGTIPVGYADGLLRKLTGQEVLIAGERAKIIGNVCMDQCMIALTRPFEIGQEVVLIGKQQQNEISVDEWAKKLGTINYEVTCTLTSRVPRIYTKDA